MTQFKECAKCTWSQKADLQHSVQRLAVCFARKMSQEVLPFYGHSGKQAHSEMAYGYQMPAFARQSWTPPEIPCHYSEKAIMALKASLFDDEETYWLIAESETPQKTKALGRQVKNFKEDVWAQHLEELALDVVLQKFQSSKRLQRLLLSTGKSIIVEAAPSDRIWGVGLSKNDWRIWNPSLWDGKNVLGNALMEARAQLQAAKAPDKKRWRTGSPADLQAECPAEHPAA